MRKILLHPHFICQRCAADNVLEIDVNDGFPQGFVWDCLECSEKVYMTAKAALRDGMRGESYGGSMDEPCSNADRPQNLVLYSLRPNQTLA